MEQWADGVLRFVMRCGSGRPEAEDAVQEAYARLWQRHDAVPSEKGRAFLMTVAYRYAMSRFRHAKVEQSHAEAWADEASCHPAEQLEQREAIEWALRRLPTEQKALLQLRDVEGFSYKEMADMLQLSEQQVQVYLFRARVAMRKMLQKLGY